MPILTCVDFDLHRFQPAPILTCTDYADFVAPKCHKSFNQAKLSCLVRDLNLPKASALILGSRLKAKCMLRTDTTFALYKHRENEYIDFFAKEHSLVYCVDVQDLI